MTAANRKRKRGRKQKKKKNEKKNDGRRSKNGERQRRDVGGQDVYVSDILEDRSETPLERWRRDASPLLSNDHRIAWLCGDPSKLSDIITILTTWASSSRGCRGEVRLSSNGFLLASLSRGCHNMLLISDVLMPQAAQL